jgi:hypothetical protein
MIRKHAKRKRKRKDKEKICEERVRDMYDD